MERNSWLRILTSAGVVAVLAIAFLLREVSVYFFDAVCLALLVFAVYEVMRAKDMRKADIKNYYIYIYIAFAYIGFFIGCVYEQPFSVWMHLITQIIVFAVFSAYTFFMYYADKPFVKQCVLKKLPVGRECKRVLFGYWSIIAYPALLLFTLFALNHIGKQGGANIGLFALLLVFVISCFTDTTAYLVGRTLQGPKLVPKISPKKTISGAVGGILGGWLGALLLVLIFSSNQAFSDFMTQHVGNATVVIVIFSLVGIFGSVISQAGDIYASMIKRKHGIKDFGNYLPGHGGVMDRLDGVSFNSVFIFFIMLIIVFVC